MNILVTGAAGLIGSHTTDLLLDAGHVVDGIDDLSYGTLSNLSRCYKK
jgi:nucleoside-diphosphate-sugar epimerase